MELGAKIAFIKETKHFAADRHLHHVRDADGQLHKGLGVGKVWYKLPIWVQKNEGKWTA